MSSSGLPLCFVPHLTLPVIPVDVLPAVPVDVSGSIDLLKAGVWCWPCSCMEETHVAASSHPVPTTHLSFFWNGWSMGHFLLPPPSE